MATAQWGLALAARSAARVKRESGVGTSRASGPRDAIYTGHGAMRACGLCTAVGCRLTDDRGPSEARAELRPHDPRGPRGASPQRTATASPAALQGA